jgi:hypothetical protein
MRQLSTYLLLLTSITAYCQKDHQRIIGRYSDDVTQLELRADSSFVLKTPDYVFPYTYQSYQSEGRWTIADNVVVLNPDKKPRYPQMSMSERAIDGQDSIEIRINYKTEVYENEVSVGKEPRDFNMMTISVNKSKNYRNLVREPVYRVCLFSPQTKKQYIVDSSNIVRFPKQRVEQIGIYTYGFGKRVKLIPKDPDANYFEIEIIQPVDRDRTPRSKKLIIKGNNAYYYEHDGKVSTSGSFSSLKRMSDE